MDISDIDNSLLCPHPFYDVDTVTLAKNLLGCFLGVFCQETLCLGRIVETEAYLSKNDPACHAHKGKTKRNESMFGPPGIAYVYLIYGVHYCFNVVSGECGVGEAVLIRAVEPLLGLDVMRKNRAISDPQKLCKGPGNLCKALGITKNLDGKKLDGTAIGIYQDVSFGNHFSGERIAKSRRIGVNEPKVRLLRFFFDGNSFVSAQTKL